MQEESLTHISTDPHVETHTHTHMHCISFHRWGCILGKKQHNSRSGLLPFTGHRALKTIQPMLLMKTTESWICNPTLQSQKNAEQPGFSLCGVYMFSVGFRLELPQSKDLHVRSIWDNNLPPPPPWCGPLWWTGDLSRVFLHLSSHERWYQFQHPHNSISSSDNEWGVQ